MDVLTAILAILVVIAILFEIARRFGVPYPSLFVLGGLALAFIPGLPRIALQPELVLLVFLPPLLFTAAVETPIRDLRVQLAPILRLSFGLVLFTMVLVAAVVHAAIGLEWAAAFALGAIVAPTDAIAATQVFRRIGVPRVATTLLEGESLLNDATALVAYRAAVLAVASGAFILSDALATFVIAAAGGVALGALVGRVGGEVLRRLDDPPVEVIVSLVLPFAAYLPADRFGLSGVLAAVTAGLMIGGRLGKILSPNSRVLWLSTWKMVAFVLNGFVFVLIGLELPHILEGLAGRSPQLILGLVVLVCAVVVLSRIVWVFAASLLPGSPRQVIAKRDARLAGRLTFVVSWAGLRGAVSLAAALALPATFPERDLILLLTFAVILVTLVGQGLTLPRVVRWAAWDGVELEGDEETVARAVAVPGRSRRDRPRPPDLAFASAAVRPTRGRPPGSDPAPRHRGSRRDGRTPPGARGARGDPARGHRRAARRGDRAARSPSDQRPDPAGHRARARPRGDPDGGLTAEAVDDLLRLADPRCFRSLCCDPEPAEQDPALDAQHRRVHRAIDLGSRVADAANPDHLRLDGPTLRYEDLCAPAEGLDTERGAARCERGAAQVEDPAPEEAGQRSAAERRSRARELERVEDAGQFDLVARRIRVRCLADVALASERIRDADGLCGDHGSDQQPDDAGDRALHDRPAVVVWVVIANLPFRWASTVGPAVSAKGDIPPFTPMGHVDRSSRITSPRAPLRARGDVGWKPLTTGGSRPSARRRGDG